MEILSFFAGIVLFYAKTWEALLFLFALCCYTGRIHVVFYFLLGVAWALVHQYASDDRQLPKTMAINHAHLTGVVSSIPKINPQKTQFQFEVQTFNDKPAGPSVWISCYQHCPKVHVGEQWSLMANLKKPKPYALPGEMNPTFWMMSNHLQWFGVMHGQTARLMAKPAGLWRFQAFRSNLADSLEKLLPGESSLGLIQGLTLGVASHLDKTAWDLFRRTGTTHLVVISGEHIGLIAGFCYVLMRYAWVVIPRLAMTVPAQQAAALFAWGMACFYACLAGLGAPLERALIGFGILLLRYFISNRHTVWQAWRYALLLILCIEPHMVVTPGFYLSFLAVAILVLVSARFPMKRIKQMVSLQLACLLGLMPLTLYAFSYASLNGFLVNLVTIPWLGFVVVPTALIGLVLIQLYPWSGFLWPSKVSAHFFMCFLTYMDTFSWMNLVFPMPNLLNLLGILVALVLFVLMPITSLFPLYGSLIVFALMPHQQKIADTEAVVTVFDVGQGLSVLIETAHHVLLYDTGGTLYQGGDWASFKVMPYLQYRHIKRIDGLVISHPDMDHRGGMKSIEQAFSVKHLWVNDPTFYHRGASCHQIKPWVWDGVDFQFFPLPIVTDYHGLSIPSANAKGQSFTTPNRNNTCCILQVKTQHSSLLITGDIEKRAEQYLVSHVGSGLKSDYLVVPHHGSATSSSHEFLMLVAPKLGIISSGLHNKYHFPHRQTLMTYQRLNISLKNTATAGPVVLTLG